MINFVLIEEKLDNKEWALSVIVSVCIMTQVVVMYVSLCIRFDEVITVNYHYHLASEKGGIRED